MKRNLSIAIIGLLFSQQVEAARLPSLEARTAFRNAVEEYQVFVVPRCAPQEVEAYVAARTDRDRSFVQSLRNTRLFADYKKAVAHRAKEDEQTVFHCFGPPPPPPPPPGTASSQPVPDNKPKNTLAERDPMAKCPQAKRRMVAAYSGDRLRDHWERCREGDSGQFAAVLMMSAFHQFWPWQLTPKLRRSPLALSDPKADPSRLMSQAQRCEAAS
jgi:hypothetical protein